MKKLVHILSLFAGLSLILSACSQRGVITPANNLSTASEPASKNAPTSALVSPLGSQIVGSKGVPTPAPARAAVAGRIVPSPSTTYAIAGINIFFGTRLPLTPGPDFLVNVSPQTSPKALLDADGFFSIADLPPGEYALVIWNPFSSVMIGEKQDPDKVMMIKVSAGQQLDLGALITRMP